MNKVITINLGGVAFQLEDAGYDALRAYLETAKARLRGNPDRDEILSDVERAISEKFAAHLTPHKNVVLEKEVADVIAEMGEVADESQGNGATGATAAGAATADRGAPAAAGNTARTGGGGGPRRLYRILEGRKLSGVCNGLGVYFDVDPTLFRLAFVITTFLWGFGLLPYLVLHFVLPVARTPEEKAEATGNPATAQEFIRRAKEGYYDALKSLPDKHARREWKRRFKSDMREWRDRFRGDMTAGAYDWRRDGPSRPGHPGAGLFLPIFSLLHGVLILMFVLALISLFAHGHILGVPVPAGMPIWMAAILLFLLFAMLKWPLKAARRSYYYAGGAGGPAWGLFCVVDVLVWIVVVFVCLSIARHHFPEIREALHNLPAVVHDAANGIRDWWHGKA